MQAGERDKQLLGQKYRSGSQGLEASFAGRRGEVAKMVGDAAAGTEVAVAGINQREKEQREQREWYERIQSDERKRRNKRALLGVGGALLGGIAGSFADDAGGDAASAGAGAGAGAGVAKNPTIARWQAATGFNDVSSMAESMMPNLSMNSMGMQMQMFNQMLAWSRMLQGAQMGMGLAQGFDF